MNFYIVINLELSAICHKIFSMHVPIYYCGMIVKRNSSVQNNYIILHVNKPAINN